MSILGCRFSTSIEPRLVELKNANDILRFSFVAQYSVSPLDLSQREERITFNRHVNIRGFQPSSILSSTIHHPKYIINTEEKCRKILSTTRDFLYRLHLDLPKNRECSLKNGLERKNMLRSCDPSHIGKIIAHPNFYFTVLASLVKEAVKLSDKKLKMIKFLLTFDTVTEDVRLSTEDALFFSKYMYPEVTESAFVKAFLKKLDLGSWMIRNDKPEILEFFLYHLRVGGGTFKDNFEPIETCMISQNFLKISTILKFQDAPRVPPPDMFWLVYFYPFERAYPLVEVLCEADKWMSRRRLYLMVQILYTYFSCPTPSAAESLRILWNSLPDAFLSYEEIEKALHASMNSEAIREVYNFYSGAVGVFHEQIEPRSLKDLSRPVVRRMLWESGCWIPDGIKLIGVPRELEIFLNLET